MTTVIKLVNFQKKREGEGIGDNWNKSFEAFLNHCVAKNLRKKTIEWYEEVLLLYFQRDFLDNTSIKCPKDFEKSDVDQYIVFLREEKGLSDTTVNIRLRALRSFFNFLMEYKYIENEIKIKTIKEDAKTIQVFTEEEVKKLIEKPKGDYISFATFRDWVMVNFLIGTGVRLATLRNIKIGDVKFANNEIHLTHTKNREEQIFPLGLSLSHVLREYMAVRGGDSENFLFCNSYGEKIGERTVGDRLKKYCQERLGNNGMRYCCHDFRHTFAVMYIRNSGGDILTLQKLLGHKSLEVTRRYANMLMGDIQRQFAKHSPLDNLASAKKSGRKAIHMKKK
jgi:integrase/recombinase XerD